MLDFTIRRAERNDIPYLIEFQQKLGFETEGLILDISKLQKGMMAMFDDPAKGFYNVAVFESEIIACHMITYEWSDWRNGWVYWLQSVYVKDDFRKHGVFKKMYDQLERQLKMITVLLVFGFTLINPTTGLRKSMLLWE